VKREFNSKVNTNRVTQENYGCICFSLKKIYLEKSRDFEKKSEVFIY